MPYKPPQNLWEVSEQLRYNEPLLDANDPRYVDTSPGRTLGYERLFRSLGVDPATDTLKVKHPSQYHLFCGHRGSGKSTELRQLKQRLNRKGLFRVIFLDVLEDLDVNSLQYPDVCLALARRLFAELEAAKHVKLDQVFLTPLENWFNDRLLVREEFRELKAGLETGAKTEGGIPFFARLFANITASFQVGSKVKDEVRTVFKSAYSEFAQAFNQLIAHVEERMGPDWEASRLLFIIDGTDRLDQKDSVSFFIEDVYQLRQIEGLFIYCAPIHLIYTSNAVQQGFDHVCKIPALKLHEKHDPRAATARMEIPATYEVLRKLILKRAPAALFDPDPHATGDWSTVGPTTNARAICSSTSRFWNTTTSGGSPTRWCGRYPLIRKLCADILSHNAWFLISGFPTSVRGSWTAATPAPCCAWCDSYAVLREEVFVSSCWSGTTLATAVP